MGRGAGEARQRFILADSGLEDQVHPLPGALDQPALGQGSGQSAEGRILLVENVLGSDTRGEPAWADHLQAVGEVTPYL